MGCTFVKNNRYLIKTPHGWDDFEGVTVSYHQEAFDISFDDNSNIKATEGHCFFNESDSLVKTEQLLKNNTLSGKTITTITPIDHGTRYEPYYDVFDVKNDEHSYFANNIKVKNCDELAFIQSQKIARSMWSSVFPTLSCLHPDTYVLCDDGYVKIKHYFRGNELSGEYFKFLNEKIYGGYGLESLSHGYVSPSSDTVILTTKTGYRVEVTPKHPLCVDTIHNMKPSKDIEKGERLRCDINMNMFGSSNYSGHDFVSTDKDYHFPEYVMMYSKQDTVEFLLNHFDQVFAFDALYQMKLMFANLGIITTIKDERLYIHNESLYKFIDELGYYPEYIDYERIDITNNCFFDEVVSIEYGYEDVLYDFTVPDSHAFLQNGIMGSNTGGGCIITSTPSDDETLFAEIWNGANKTIDENGNDTDVGINGFKALKVTWDQHPERDDSYKQLQIAAFGEEKFRREHELEFISMEETLIDPVFLSEMEGIDPISKTGQIRWYKPLDKDKMYFIGYDPSLGTGRDNAAIVIYEFPTLIQVGEWIHNKSDVPAQIRILKTILDQFEQQGFDEDNVFWSLENNSIGEAPLVMIKNEVGEDEFFGTFMKEKKKRNVGRVRGGFTTDHSSKMSACSRFKVWLEHGKMVVKSKPLIAELKGFVQSGRTYKARSGDKDDIIMATLLVVRMMEIVMKDEEDYLEELGVTASNLLGDDDDEDDDGWRQPMPVI